MNPFILGIDTSARASVALLRLGTADPQVLFSRESADTTSHAEDVSVMVREALELCRAEGFDAPGRVAVGAGPGPFTGLRVGIATADALALAWGIPLDTVDSLDALAHEGAHALEGALGDGDPGEGQILGAYTDARRHEVYGAIYGVRRVGTHLTARRVAGPSVAAASVAAEQLEGLAGGHPLAILGEGVRLYADQFEERCPAAQVLDPLRPNAVHVALIAAEALAEGRILPRLAPQYLRDSDAQVPGPRKKAL